jgi:hypothetical protein
MISTYDSWKASGPHDNTPNASAAKGLETCEHCGAPVAAVSVAYCTAGRHYSYWPSRPERLGR